MNLDKIKTYFDNRSIKKKRLKGESQIDRPIVREFLDMGTAISKESRKVEKIRQRINEIIEKRREIMLNNSADPRLYYINSMLEKEEKKYAEAEAAFEEHQEKYRNLRQVIIGDNDEAYRKRTEKENEIQEQLYSERKNVQPEQNVQPTQNIQVSTPTNITKTETPTVQQRIDESLVINDSTAKVDDKLSNTTGISILSNGNSNVTTPSNNNNTVNNTNSNLGDPNYLKTIAASELSKYRTKYKLKRREARKEGKTALAFGTAMSMFVGYAAYSADILGQENNLVSPQALSDSISQAITNIKMDPSMANVYEMLTQNAGMTFVLSSVGAALSFIYTVRHLEKFKKAEDESSIIASDNPANLGNVTDHVSRHI